MIHNTKHSVYLKNNDERSIHVIGGGSLKQKWRTIKPAGYISSMHNIQITFYVDFHAILLLNGHIRLQFLSYSKSC